MFTFYVIPENCEYVKLPTLNGNISVAKRPETEQTTNLLSEVKARRCARADAVTGRIAVSSTNRLSGYIHLPTPAIFVAMETCQPRQKV